MNRIKEYICCLDMIFGNILSERLSFYDQFKRLLDENQKKKKLNMNKLENEEFSWWDVSHIFEFIIIFV